MNNKQIKDKFTNEIEILVKNSNPLKANLIYKIFPENIVYINHYVTPENRKIFWFTKFIAKEYNWKFV